MYRCTKMDSDLRVGGLWRTEGKGADGNPFAVWGRYTRVDPPTALGFTWNHDWGQSGVPETQVLIELTATSFGTHVTLTHSGFVSSPDRDAHNQGGSASSAGCARISRLASGDAATLLQSADQGLPA